ncbi:MAG: type VI secretion system ATPase TssH [Saezia sp.]
MVQVDLAALLKHLNPETKLALEQAASLCISQQGSEITISHWLLTLLDNPVGDFRTLLKLAIIDVEQVRNVLTRAFAHQNQTINPYPSFSPLLIDLIKEAWTLGSVELRHQQIRSGVLILCALLNAPRYLPFEAIELFEKINREALRKDFNKLFSETSEHPATEATKAQGAITSEAESALQKFAHDFTKMAKEGRIDPVLCRDAEIDQMIDILTRRRKNNPIAVGDAGVGKSALVEGLAQRIVDKRVPKSLQDVSLWGLDMGALQAGASVKGEFEKRLKAVIDEVKHSPRPIILFIDEAHTLIGAGNAAGGSDAANLLKPALARGELKTIAATTWSEYKKYFEKDPALSRRFQLVKLSEPTIEQAIHIIRGLRPIYEKAHKVYISDDAVHAAVNMSARFITGRQLPDKAIDVLDTACARVATALAEPPRKLSALENKKVQTRSELDLLERDGKIGKQVDQERIQELGAELDKIEGQKESLQHAWGQQKLLIEEIQSLRVALGYDLDAPSSDLDTQENTPADKPPASDLVSENKMVEQDNELSEAGKIKTELSVPNHAELTEQIQQKVIELLELQKEEALLHADVGAEQVAQVISDWTGVPATTISADRMHRLKAMPEILGQKVKGQDEGIAQIHRHLLTAMADLRRPGTPLGAFLFVGPSGVGKTETARVLAEDFFGGLQFLTCINMSEYQEKHTVSRLLGSPPGYVGYGEGGLLTEAIRQKPYSVVLLDEVDKAHPEVLNVFYQAFDKGTITDGEGQLISCTNILFLLTSNIGFDMVEGALDEPDQVSIRKKLMEFFKPALLARMQVVLFKHLDEEVLAEIVDMRLNAVQKQLHERYKASLILKDEVKEELKSRCIRHENGARMLDASIDGELLPPLSLAILEYLAMGNSFSQVVLDWDGEEFKATLS